MRWMMWLVCMGLAAQVHAGCALVATVPASFGTVNSNAVRLTQQQTSTQTAGLACTKALISLLSTNDHVFLTVTSSLTGLVGPTGDVITYSLYGDGTTTYPISRGVALDYARSPLVNLLGILGGQPSGAPLYMRTTVGSDVAAGLYQEQLTLTWSWDYCPSVGALNACLTAREVGTGASSLNVNLTVSNDCTIVAPNINFASAPVVSGFPTVSGTLNLACTKGSSYTVGFSDGGNLSAGRRRMISGSDYLAYDIFKGASVVRWGSVAGDRRASSTADLKPGPGLGNSNQNFNYNARIYTDQTTPPAGSYLDSVVLDVQF